jgi:HSP20 family molecular chaperone IbpA
MDIVTTIPVRLNGPESILPRLEEVRDRIARRAYENFVDRGALHGHDIDDWISAERELTIKPAAEVRAEGADVFVEMLLPEIDLPNITVHIAPRQFVISSDPDEDGLQLCQVIDLPVKVSLDGVDAERMHNMLRITAAVA